MPTAEPLQDYCLRVGKIELLSEWDEEKNTGFSIRSIPHSSQKKVWWRCKQGHSWKATVGSRIIQGTGCPYCSGVRIWPGYNDLQTKRPELAAEWDMEKNAPLTPNMIGTGSPQKVWWICPKGHSYRSSIWNRARPRSSGCPYCKKMIIAPGINDPKTLNPELAAQWDEKKNAPVKMEDLQNASTYKAWWLCEHGHSYQARIIDRNYKKTGCPYCAGQKAYPGFNDLASQMPELAKEWDAELNAPLTAEMVTLGSGKLVWWSCDQGHVWRARIFNRTKSHGNGCPVCGQCRKGKAQLRYDRVMGEIQVQKAQKKQYILLPQEENETKSE